MTLYYLGDMIKMAKKYTKFKDYLVKKLRNPRKAQIFLDVAVSEYEEDGDSKAFALALRYIAEAQGGVGKLAGRTDLDRQNLYKIFEGQTVPRLDTFTSILRGLGYKLRVEQSDHIHN